MKITSIAAAMLLASASAAHAANVSSPVETLTVHTGKNSLAFDNTFKNVSAGDTFADRFNFKLTGESDLKFTVTSTAAGKNTSLDLTGFGIFNAATNAVVANGTLNYLNYGGVFDKWTVIANDLAAGNYYFKVSGKMLAQGGSFAANGTMNVSPVPEPAMPAMLLGGLAIVAFAVRRKAL
jgi:PEP-CTERM motif